MIPTPSTKITRSLHHKNQTRYYHYIHLTCVHSVLVHNIWKCLILIGWLVITIFEQCMLNLGNGWLYLATGTIPVWYDFQCTLYLWNRFSCIIFIYFFGKIYLCWNRRHCLSFAVIMTRFGNVNANKFT